MSQPVSQPASQLTSQPTSQPASQLASQPAAHGSASFATHYPIEYEFPDITPYAGGNVGVPYVFAFDSGVPGPTAMVCALTHGNEMAGTVVLDALLKAQFRPRRGKLLLTFNNVAAYARFDRADPDAARYVDEDFNRVWDTATLEGPRHSVDLARARELRRFVAEADYLLDIHSMHEKAPPILVCGTLEKGVDFGKQLGAPGHLLIDQGHAQGKRMRDYGGFGEPNSPKNATLIECGQHWEANSPKVACDLTARFLESVGVSDASDLPRGWRQPNGGPQQVVRVDKAIAPKTDTFRFARRFSGLEVLQQGEVIGYDGAPEAEEAIAAPYDNCVLVMPSIRHAAPGVTVVRLGRLDR
jgi:predicted deacylase